MLDGVNKGKLDDVHFFIDGYNHYHSCHLKRKYQKYELIDEPVFECIELSLCDDGSESSFYHGEFLDKEKVFNIKGKGRFTLREIFNLVKFISIIECK